MTTRTVARDEYSKVSLAVAPGVSRARFRAVDYDGEVEFYLDRADLVRLRDAIDETIGDLRGPG